MSDATAQLQLEVRRLAHLVAVLGTDGKSQREQVRLLSAAGFPPKDIAKLIDTTPNTVRVALANLKKKPKNRKRRQK